MKDYQKNESGYNASQLKLRHLKISESKNTCRILIQELVVIWHNRAKDSEEQKKSCDCSYFETFADGVVIEFHSLTAPHICDFFSTLF